MKKILTLSGGLVATAMALLAAPPASVLPEEYVTRSASGSTAATVYFEPGVKSASLLVADVTSDKAASVLSWRVGTNQLTILSGAAADTTNLYTTVGNVVSNVALVSVTANGTVTAHTAFTNSYLTNTLVTLENPIGTNAPVGSVAREVTSTYFTILESSSTNVVSIASNLNAIAVGTNFAYYGGGARWETNQVKSWITNGANFDITLSNNFSFLPERAYVVSAEYLVSFTNALAADASLVLTNGTGLAAGDSLMILPSSGGAVVRQIQSVGNHRVQLQPLKAVTGLALNTGDRLFVLDTAITTPVGAATLRLMADPVRILPANVPAVLSVDGTSACAINAAVVRYK